MIDKNEILDYFKNNKTEILEKYQLISLGLFGSFARNEQTDKSDIDLIIEFKENAKNIHSTKANLKREVGEKFNIDVDICRDKYIKDCFKNLIYKDAIYI